MGPLTGVKVIEFAGIGPGPFCGMLLSDMGAEVIRIDRKGAKGGGPGDIASRNKKSIAVDLKKPEGVETVLRLIETADILQEGFRPGVMERLGLGPDVCLKRNPKLVYGRMTGWGQDGPLSQAAGHDINYISITGALHAIGPKGGKPVPPLNLVGDFGGGALYLAMGMLAALTSARTTGKGQVVDAAMTDGAASLMAMFFTMSNAGMWNEERANNMLDGGAPFYDTYETSDGKYISLGSIEPQFYALLREKAGLSEEIYDAQHDRAQWSIQKDKIAAVMKTKTRDQWDVLMMGTDVCYGPVLSLSEAPDHPHNKARETFVTVDGVVQPNIAPRFFGTPSGIRHSGPMIGANGEEVLADAGLSADEIAALKTADVF